MKRLFYIGGAVLGVFWILTVATMAGRKPPAKKPPPTVAMTYPSVDSTMLKRSEYVLEEAQREGVLGTVTYNTTISRAVVRPSFYSLDFNVKRGICGAISITAKAEGYGGNVVLHDSKTNDKVGTFNEMTGEFSWSGGRY